MLRIAICDDDISITGEVEELLISFEKKYGIELEIETYSDGEMLIHDMQELQLRFDIIYLDIEMKTLNGLETSKEIRKMDEIVLLIFITNHESFAKELFSVQTFDFILKPIDHGIFKKVFEKAYKLIGSGDFYFEYKFNRVYYKLPVQEIIYFQSEKRMIWVKTTTGMHMFYGKINKVEKYFNKTKVDFWRIHHSFLVNSRYITKITYKSLELVTGEELNISEDRQKKIKEKYGNSLESINWL